MERTSRTKALSGFERILLFFGLLLICIYVGVRFYGAFYSRATLQRFWETQRTINARDASPAKGGEPDFRLWSQQRIAAYKTSLREGVPVPLGVLRIQAIHLEVPVLEGTDDLTLNQGAGHIEGTATPGEAGNVGIAGHRDGFFRGLKDIRLGDAIDLTTAKRTDRYLVDEVLIVSPEDVSVLGARLKPSLTLVTCYPFYFVGSAPQRFIVHASITDPAEHMKPN